MLKKVICGKKLNVPTESRVKMWNFTKSASHKGGFPKNVFVTPSPLVVILLFTLHHMFATTTIPQQMINNHHLTPHTRDNRAVKWSVWWIPWQMNHFCMFYVSRTDLWDNFYFGSVFAYCSKGTYKCEEIVVAIFKMSLKIHPQDKMLLRIKICKWNRFQEQFSLSLWHQAKLLIWAQLHLGNTVYGQI